MWPSRSARGCIVHLWRTIVLQIAQKEKDKFLWVLYRVQVTIKIIRKATTGFWIFFFLRSLSIVPGAINQPFFFVKINPP